MLYAILPGIGPQEMVIIAIFGVLLFGKRLPEVGKSLGKGIAQFKQGMSGVEDELRSIGREARSNKPASTPSYNAAPAVSNDLAPDPAVPKFEPPTAAPAPRSNATAAAEPVPYQD